MLTKQRKMELSAAMFSLAAAIFMFWQLASGGPYRDVASLCLGMAFLGILFVVWAGKRA